MLGIEHLYIGGVLGWGSPAGLDLPHNNLQNHPLHFGWRSHKRGPRTPHAIPHKRGSAREDSGGDAESPSHPRPLCHPCRSCRPCCCCPRCRPSNCRPPRPNCRPPRLPAQGRAPKQAEPPHSCPPSVQLRSSEGMEGGKYQIPSRCCEKRKGCELEKHNLNRDGITRFA